MFDVNFLVLKFIIVEKMVVIKINFIYWILYYRLFFEVVIYGELEIMFNFIIFMYIRVVKVGDNFFFVSSLCNIFQKQVVINRIIFCVMSVIVEYGYDEFIYYELMFIVE